jgi:hypothetical protein
MAEAYICSLSKVQRHAEICKVNDESIRDTLIDLANYAIMTVVEMEVADDAE